MKKACAGLLPLYIKLYDDSTPEMRPKIEAFYEEASVELEKREIEIVRVKPCCIDTEFQAAVKKFEDSKVDAIITLHLAYSPSLESIGSLAATKLPLIVLDTTPAYDFSALQEIDAISYNHGIHGVQDLCNMLNRYGKGYMIHAGHIYKSDVMDRTAACVRAAGIAGKMKTARVGIVGEPFKGMGDFYIPADILKSTIGLETIPYDFSDNDLIKASITEEDIAKEIADDYAKFNVVDVSNDTHYQSSLANLMIRKWIEREGISAFTVNFLDITQKSGIPRMTFIEASKSMARGIGYAGEGDVLTAAFVGALLSAFPETSFVEMFCPGWSDDTIFISHMGEMNIALSAEKPLAVEEPFPYTDVGNSVIAYGRLKPGEAVFVNLAPYPGEQYALIITSVNMLEVDGVDKFERSIHGWFKPCMPVPEFLEKYSQAAGTHHGAIVYGEVSEELEMLGKIMGWKVIRLE